jgi:hypothetical protein
VTAATVVTAMTSADDLSAMGSAGSAGDGTPLDLRHLLRMSDEVGLFEHADGAIPRREHGYCVDDVSRGLLLLCREPFPSEAVVELAGRYLTFLAHAQGADGGFHNRLGYDRCWHDEPGTGDWWGRALWGLGTAVAGSPAPWIREAALRFFERGAHLRSGHLRSMAFAALGAIEVLTADPAHQAARVLLADTVLAIGAAQSSVAQRGAARIGTSQADAPKLGAQRNGLRPTDPRPTDLNPTDLPSTDLHPTDLPSAAPEWPWPQDRLDYANAVLPEVLIRAGRLLGDEAALARGLDLLDWLLAVESNDGHLSPAPVGGAGPGDRRPGYDQQPIEIAALADACATAFSVTGDPRWAAEVRRTAAWFGGDNDAHTVMYDPVTGGGYDGLTEAGRNGNQGAESTLALLTTLQVDRRLRTENP